MGGPKFPRPLPQHPGAALELPDCTRELPEAPGDFDKPFQDSPDSPNVASDAFETANTQPKRPPRGLKRAPLSIPREPEEAPITDCH
eukprot:4225917-Pyramimonas_sp.AAC.1